MPDAIDSILAAVTALQSEKQPLVIAMDGRSAAGKTTLAARLHDKLGCTVLHMDDFFLRPEQRTAERLLIPGGNVDYERFSTEVLLPLKAGKPFSFRPYCCKTQRLMEATQIVPAAITLVEGAYACHPALWEYYDLRIFVTVKKDEQRARIMERNGREEAAAFLSKWIPLEERYFDAYGIMRRCDLVCEACAADR